MYKQIPLAISPDTELTFEHFYLCHDAEPVVLELQHFVTSPMETMSKISEPFLYLWGESGSGVTHLLSATQNANQALSMQYLPLKELMQYSPLDVFEGIETLDLICIDDIEQLAGKREWEEAFFYIFNRLRDSNKKLLVGGHLPPAQLSIDLSDLKSRLQWGLILHLPSLQDQDKKQALQFYAKQRGLQLNNEVANFMLQRCPRSSSVLFELMKKLDHASLAEHRKLTIPFIKTVLSADLNSL